MSRGGFRPGGGRPATLNADGTRKNKVRVRSKTPKVAAKTAVSRKPRLFQPSATPPVPIANPFMRVEEAIATPSIPPPDAALEPFPAKLLPQAEPALPTATADDVPSGMVARVGAESPLEYMLRVMNTDGDDDNRRDKMAIAAAPFVHVRAGEVGKKDQKAEAAKKASAGKFSSTSPPKLVVNNH